MIANWIDQHGLVCPGWGRHSHNVDALTVDHILPRSRGGQDIEENIRVLCRSCNSRRGTKRDPIVPGPAPSWPTRLT